MLRAGTGVWGGELRAGAVGSQHHLAAAAAVPSPPPPHPGAGGTQPGTERGLCRSPPGHRGPSRLRVGGGGGLG